MPRTLDPDEILARLFGSVSRARIIAFFVSQTGRAFYQRGIMYETGLSLKLTQRELRASLRDLWIRSKTEQKGVSWQGLKRDISWRKDCRMRAEL